MRWLGLFKNKIFRKHLKLIFPHSDFIIFIVSSAIFHTYFSICILSSAFCHPHFIIRIFLSAIRHPPSAVIRSALYRDPSPKLTASLKLLFLTRARFISITLGVFGTSTLTSNVIYCSLTKSSARVTLTATFMTCSPHVVL